LTLSPLDSDLTDEEFRARDALQINVLELEGLGDAARHFSTDTIPPARLSALFASGGLGRRVYLLRRRIGVPCRPAQIAVWNGLTRFGILLNQQATKPCIDWHGLQTRAGSQLPGCEIRLRSRGFRARIPQQADIERPSASALGASPQRSRRRRQRPAFSAQRGESQQFPRNSCNFQRRCWHRRRDAMTCFAIRHGNTFMEIADLL
jgi:hypothetical protein